ncbi:MAG: helix-turn-helix transcriptional regulator [Methylobacter sp.]
MDRFERIYQLHGILSGRRTPIANKDLQARLECSAITVKRLINLMCNHFDAPIVYNRQLNGYHYDNENGAHPYELPGLWFNADELWGLLTCHTLLSKLSRGIFGEHVIQLQKRVEKLLALDNSSAGRKLESVKILAVAARQKGASPLFNKIAFAMFDRQQLHLTYEARSNGETTQRDVSPQTLIYYRDNWYLDAWCHRKNKLRTFAVENIQTAARLDRPAQTFSRAELDDFFSSAYGLFSGQAEHLAKLKFSPERARWIKDEHWHSEQQVRWLDDGGYGLSIPFSDHRELLMDILKHGRHVEILEPEFLRQAVRDEIQAMKKIYQKDETGISE